MREWIYPAACGIMTLGVIASVAFSFWPVWFMVKRAQSNVWRRGTSLLAVAGMFGWTELFRFFEKSFWGRDGFLSVLLAGAVLGIMAVNAFRAERLAQIDGKTEYRSGRICWKRKPRAIHHEDRGQ